MTKVRMVSPITDSRSKAFTKLCRLPRCPASARPQSLPPAPPRAPAEAAAIHTDTSAGPFLLKLPGQTSGAVDNKPLPTVVTRRLITEILSRHLTEPAAIPSAIAPIEAEMP